MAEARPLSVYVIAGESSGDLLGAHLMRALKELSPAPIRFHGVGGDKMAAVGLQSLFPFHELSMLGFIEVLPHALRVFARVNLTVEDILAKAPDVVVTIDVPGFSLRVAKKLREEGFTGKLIHYVAPTVWAYKPQRAEICAKLFDHLLVLLPFEPPYFEKVGLPCTFVGHPVVCETQAGNADAFRKKFEIAGDVTLFTLLPGSRKGEIARHMPVFARAMTLIAQRIPKLAIFVATPKHVLPLVAPYFEGCPFRAVITANEEDKKNAFAASNLALVKSGTVALEVAMAGAPMLVTYRVNPISAYLLKRISLTKYVNLINILSKAEIIPELLQERCNPEAVAQAALTLLESPARQAEQKTGAAKALDMLRPPAGELPSRLAAKVILGMGR